MSESLNRFRFAAVRKRATMATALAVVLALAASAAIVGATTATAADGAVSGTVFRDFNSNGVFDTGYDPLTGVANDRPLAGITVTATDGLGVVVGQAVTGADGTYSLPVEGALNDHVRIEFSGGDATLEPAGTSAAGSNGTSVQFVDLGATGVDFALAMPGDYAQNDPPILTTLMHPGQRGLDPNDERVTVVATPWTTHYTEPRHDSEWNDPPNNPNCLPSDPPQGVVGGCEPNWDVLGENDFPDRVILATVPQTGSVWGSVFNGTQNEAYVSATLKRHSDLGPLGLGGIYRIPNVLGTDGNINANASERQVENWIDVTQLGGGIDVGQQAFDDAGPRGLGAPDNQTHDVPGFNLAGRVGIGGVAVDDLRQQLHFVNLFDKQLYSLDLTTFDPDEPSAATVSVVDLSLRDDERPWALTIHGDAVYVGTVDTGENQNAGTSAEDAGLKAQVYATAASDVTGPWTEVINFDLDYRKGHSTIGSGNDAEGAHFDRITQWNTWVNEWGPAVETTVWDGGDAQIYPQPILSDLAIDTEGYLVLAFLDRTSVQGGNRNWPAEVGKEYNFETFSSGDLLIAAPDGDGGFELEDNGQVGDREADEKRPGQGPGGYEFFNDSLSLGRDGPHQEIGLGSSAIMPGVDVVVAGTYDPLADIRVTGFNWFSLTEGSHGVPVAGYQMNVDTFATSDDAGSGSFQKGGGLGAVSLLARSAPVEIGNRVWFDADQDGLQGADEPHIVGLDVQLIDAAGDVVAETQTDANGEYIFRSDEDGFDTQGDYVVVFVKPTTGTVTLGGPNFDSFGTLEWADVDFTTQGSGSPLDSNADPDTGEAPVTIVGPGYNDHTIDAGFTASVAFTVTKEIDDAGGAPTAGQIFTMNVVAEDFRGTAITPALADIEVEGGETSEPVLLPVGASVWVTEAGTYVDTVLTDPDGEPHSTYFTLDSVDEPFNFTVTNTLEISTGSIEITKAVTGDFGLASPEIAGATFTVGYSYLDEDDVTVSGELDLVAPAWSAQLSDLPVGTEVTLDEVNIADAGAGVGFDTPTWSAGEQSDGTALITVGDGSAQQIVLTNPTTQLVGGFEVTKSVSGDFDLTDPELADATFTVAYEHAGGSGQFVLSSANDWSAQVDGLPYGTTVTLEETTITGAHIGVGFDTPTWNVGGQSNGTAVITIGNGTTQEIELTNPTTQLVGGFEVTKNVTGDDEDRVPVDVEFVIEYSLDEGTTWTGLEPVTDGGTVQGLTDLPLGAEVLLREVAPVDGVDYAWGTPAFSGSGVDANDDGTATVTIGATGTATVTVENPTSDLNGQFSVTKNVTGPGESLLIDNPSFAINYESAAGNGQLTVIDGETDTSPLLPTGTEVTITEVTPDASWLPDGATWGTPTLTVDGEELENGETITIGDGSVVEVMVNNPTDVTPDVEIIKGDGQSGVIANDANTVATGEAYQPGETRTIVIRVQNTGPEPLVDVELVDATLSGAHIENLQWEFPDGTEADATFDAASGEWTVQWEDTFTGDAEWAPGAFITGTATLTMNAGDGAHQNNVTVNAEGALSGTPVSDEDPYNAFTGSIQVIKYDGELADPVVHDGDDWVIPAKPLASASQDANTSAEAVVYPVSTPQVVRWVVTNTGDTWLTDLDLADTTLNGPDIGDDWTANLTDFGGPADYSFVDDGPWSGLFPPGASFFAQGTLELAANQEHGNNVDVVGTVVVPATGPDGQPSDEPLTDGDEPVRATVPDPDNPDEDVPFVVTDDDPFHARTGDGPAVEITKGDGADGEIVHDANTMADGQAYVAGETRTVIFHVENTGDEDLVDVVLTDSTIAGATVEGLTWTLPDDSVLDATLSGTTWTAQWENTFSGDAVWAPGEIITGTATLTLTDGATHVNEAEVQASGAASGTPVSDDDSYNAFTGSIQVIKYDGELADPVVHDGDDWVIPAKPLVNAEQDANTSAEAVVYPVSTPQVVRWVVTNTGDTWLTDLDLADTTLNGPDIGDDWTANLIDFGGPADYSFVDDGPWSGLFPPGASFFAEGTLELDASEQHGNNVDVVATVVVPQTDDDGVPTDEPLTNDDDEPVRATVPDPDNPDQELPFEVSDDDPFHARSGEGPFVQIVKGDGVNGGIVNDANTMATGQLFDAGETRDVVFHVENIGDEDLVDVVLTDNTLSGAVIDGLTWTLPDGSVLDATLSGNTWTAQWENTFSGDAVWAPGEVITGTATLTLAGGDPHLNYGEVQARGAASGIPVGDNDPYNAFSAGIQVIKYDGELADPQVRDGDTWVVPAKPLVDADQDANTEGTAVRYVADEANTVRWVVTNTGSTWLTSVDLADVTDAGPAVTNWTADLSEFGGPTAYDFVTNGTWRGLIPPGASFFAEGTLTLGAEMVHANTVTVEATPVVPETNEDGLPTGEPELDNGVPVEVTGEDGNPVRLTDDDPFHAYTPTLTDAIDDGSSSALSRTGVGIAVAGMLMMAIAAVGSGFALIARSRERRHA